MALAPFARYKPSKEGLALEKAMGRFLTLFVRADTIIFLIATVYLSKRVTETMFLLRGMDSRIMAQRLKMLLRHRVKGSADLQTALDHYCDTIEMRNKLAHIPVTPSGKELDVWHLGSNIQTLRSSETTSLTIIKRHNAWLWIFINDITLFWRASLKALPGAVPSGDSLECRAIVEYPAGPKHKRIDSRAMFRKHKTKPPQSR